MGRSRSTLSMTALAASLAVACVDTSEPGVTTGDAGPELLDEPEPISLIATEPVPAEQLERAPAGPYSWRVGPQRNGAPDHLLIA